VGLRERRDKLQFSRPGKPVDNAYIESFNGRVRDECLNVHWFTTLLDAQITIETWRRDYNTARPHSALGGLSPEEFRKGADRPRGLAHAKKIEQKSNLSESMA